MLKVKQQKPRPIIAVVAPSAAAGGELAQGQKISGATYKDQPVLLVLNNPAAGSQHQQQQSHEDDDFEFDLTKLLGNFQPAAFDNYKPNQDQIELKPQDSEDGFVGGTASAQFQPGQQQHIDDDGEDFFQPDAKPIVVPQLVEVASHHQDPHHNAQHHQEQQQIQIVAEEKPVEHVAPIAAEPVSQDVAIAQPAIAAVLDIAQPEPVVQVIEKAIEPVVVQVAEEVKPMVVESAAADQPTAQLFELVPIVEQQQQQDEIVVLPAAEPAVVAWDAQVAVDPQPAEYAAPAQVEQPAQQQNQQEDAPKEVEPAAAVKPEEEIKVQEPVKIDEPAQQTEVIIGLNRLSFFFKSWINF